MASDRPEQTITLPAELVRKCAGFSFDIGGSVMKVVYRTKEDFDDAMGKQEDDAVATVRLVSFSRQELQEAVEFIKANAYITRTPGEETQVYTTGVGGFQFKAMMEEGLNVKNINIPEQDCIINSLRYLLKTMPRGQLLHPFDESAAERPMAEMKAMFDVFIEGLKKGQTNVSVPGIDIENATGDTILKGIVGGLNQAGDPAKPMTEQKEDIYPVAIGIFGSAFGVIRIEKDGTYSAMEISPRGGRACLAMACLFLDCKDFNEFLELAKKGDEDNVDWCFRDMGAESLAAKDGKESDSNEDDMYSAFSTTADDKNNPLLVCFGQGVAKKKGDFKREDLAAALMRFFCNDLAMVIDSTLRQAMHGNVKHFFVAGGFPNNTLSRHMITRELTTRLCMKMFSNPTFEPYQLHFLQHGQHLGCIGGLINTVDHFIKPAPTPDYRREGDSKDRRITKVLVPAELVVKCAGFSYDIGGSAMKVAFRAKDDYERALKAKIGGQGTIRLVSFSRQELDEAVDFIKENAHIARIDGKTTEVFTTGIGGFQYKERMEKALQVKNINIPEGDCSNNAFTYLLTKLPQKDMIHPFLEEATEKPQNEMRISIEPFLEAVRTGKTNITIPGVDAKEVTCEMLMQGPIEGMKPTGDLDKPMTQDETLFPLAVATFGSAFAMSKIDKDGNFSAMDVSNRGGRSCFALAKMLLDCESFDEFISLAAAGNSDNVDVCTRDLGAEMTTDALPENTNSGDNDDVYSKIANSDIDANALVYCFGKGVNKKRDEFRREDIACALLRFFCHDIASFVDKTMREGIFEDIKNVFVAGSFAANDLARTMITREITIKVVSKALMGGSTKSYKVHFLKHGSHLGSLGGLINTIEQFVKTQ